jgi:hypothetical protein
LKTKHYIQLAPSRVSAEINKHLQTAHSPATQNSMKVLFELRASAGTKLRKSAEKSPSRAGLASTALNAANSYVN